MVGPLRTTSGRPNLRVRVVATLVIAGLVLITAPVVVIPLVGVLGRAVF